MLYCRSDAAVWATVDLKTTNTEYQGLQKTTKEMTEPNGSLFLSTIQSCIIACGSHCQNDRSNSLP